MIHFSNVCSGKPNNWSKSLHPKKPSKGKHRARSTDVEESSSGEMLTLAIADSDNSEEYTFTLVQRDTKVLSLSFISRL